MRTQRHPVDSADLRRFRVLVAGNATSSFGSFLNMVALHLFVYQATGSAFATGVFLVVRMACGFVAGVFGGVVAARLPRKAVMVTCDLVQALVLVVFAVLPSDARVHMLPVVAVSIGLLTTTSGVVLRSSVPDLVGPENRLHANGLLVTGRAISMAVGFACGALLVSAVGYPVAFLIDAATFVVSAVVLLSTPLRFPGRSEAPAAKGGLPGRAAVVALAAAPAVLAIVLIRLVDAFGSASHQVGVPVHATQVHPGDPAVFVGGFWAAWAVGLFLAHRVANRVYRGDLRRGAWGFVVGTAVMSLAFIGAFTDAAYPLVLLLLVVAGLADGFTEISYTTRVQAEPEPARGQYFGLVAMAENAGFGIGVLVAGGLLDAWRPLTVVGLMHGVVVVVALTYLATTLLRRRTTREVPTASPRS
ncbi:MFS transporter [Actinokineospora cianjurensis]|uniref:Putative MFS family arabinose efflux permease n=1 Tax=Actinokineospora cianjurensis TaxID=585224 RepID=A0A421B0Y3_9PSEU|nr:MFS transporter [Actinokineospora cianjurensis]RLK58012.1 putative MFS family arabinose efflux permease [Actinokineospora cianjurensis]